eukprot:3176713-Prymnesium_polylepis.1
MWLEVHLRAAQPSMLCLREVTGGGKPFACLRVWLKRLGYDAKRLPAESRGALNGAVVAWRRQACRVKLASRLATRAWA